MKKSNTKTALLFKNIPTVIKNENIRRITPFTYEHTGNSFYFFDGEKVPKKDFEKKFPIKLIPIAYKGENSDRRKNWINDIKSY